MAFRTNKVPAIEERTVSGSSVSFNSAFALPLKACKVSFSATQAGSGDPSPSNPRAISGVSSIGLMANSTPVSVSLGDTRYGGVLDVLTGELKITHRHITTSSTPAQSGWIYNQANSIVFRDLGDYKSKFYSIVLCDKIKSAPAYGEVVATEIFPGRPSFISGNLGVRVDSSITSATDFVNTYGELSIVYELREPITIQLSANELSSIIGNNTFSTDTGTLEITFADLQEKSASGAVASFNTALAMPLSSCNIAVNAWQEGSGDPSPSNVRPIHGFSEVNLTANNIIHTIQLGQEVYGGSYNSVTGKMLVTSVKQIYNGTQLLKLVNWRPTSTSVGFTFDPTTYIGTHPSSTTVLSNILCNKLKTVSYKEIYNGAIDSEISISPDDNYGLFMRLPDLSLTTSEAINQYLSENPIEVVYELAEPFDIQLTPTQIETLIGNNTIFADTGDVDLTFKDLDIAKRGNFREVFKLPS